MAIEFKLETKRNPANPSAPQKYYARAVATGKDTTHALAKEIAKNSTLSKGEIVHVLMELGELIESRLQMGRTVELLDLCIISPKVSSEGVESADAFNTNKHIKKVGVNMRPKKKLLSAVQEAELKKI